VPLNLLSCERDSSVTVKRHAPLQLGAKDMRLIETEDASQQNCPRCSPKAKYRSKRRSPVSETREARCVFGRKHTVQKPNGHRTFQHESRLSQGRTERADGNGRGAEQACRAPQGTADEDGPEEIAYRRIADFRVAGARTAC
jgi:hypothetical protein